MVNGVIAIEIDGELKYRDDTTVAQVIRNENNRAKRLRNEGYWLLRFTPADLIKDPDRCVQIVADALEEHARLGSPRPRIQPRPTRVWP